MARHTAVVEQIAPVLASVRCTRVCGGGGGGDGGDCVWSRVCVAVAVAEWLGTTTNKQVSVRAIASCLATFAFALSLRHFILQKTTYPRDDSMAASITNSSAQPTVCTTR